MSDGAPTSADSGESSEATAELSAAETEAINAEDESVADQVKRVEALEASLKEKKAEEAPEEEPKKAEAEEPKKEETTTEDLAAELAAARAELEALKSQNARESLVMNAGLSREYASLISGDSESWQKQLDLLVALRGDKAEAAPASPVSVPRDPAVDADYSTEDNKMSEARSFFGLD